MEFRGAISKYDIQNDKIVFIDDVSKGLFSLDKNTFIVTPILSPLLIFPNKVYDIRQIICVDLIIYIIPVDLEHNVVVYNTKSKCVQYKRLDVPATRLGDVIHLNNKLYYLPYSTDDPIICTNEDLSLSEINVEWRDFLQPQQLCWGVSCNDSEYAFPIIGSKYVYFSRNGIIKLEIEKPIFSICLDVDSIWCVSEGGDFLFKFDYYGKLLKEIPLPQNCGSGKYDNIIRIIKAGNILWLLSWNSSRVITYHIQNDKVFDLYMDGSKISRSYFEEKQMADGTFWGYIFCENTFFLLPYKYRMKVIDVKLSLICKEKSLYVNDNFLEEDYKTWIKYSNKNEIFCENEAFSLDDYLEYIK